MSKSLPGRAKGIEISLRDLISFLWSNAKLLALLTLVFSAVGVALVSLQPQQYQKQLTLSVQPVPGTLLVKLLQPEGVAAAGLTGTKVQEMPSQQAGNLAASYLQSGGLGQVSADSRYDDNTKQVQVTLRSQDEGSLDGIGSTAANLVETNFQKYYQGSLSPVLEAQLAVLASNIDTNKAVVDQFDQQIEQSSSDSSARINGLEVERARTLGDIATAEKKQADLQQAQEDLPQAVKGLTTVKLLNESDVQRSSGSLLRKVALVVLLGFALAVIATLLGAMVLRVVRNR